MNWSDTLCFFFVFQELASLLYRAADDDVGLSPNKVNKILGVSKKDVTTGPEDPTDVSWGETTILVNLKIAFIFTNYAFLTLQVRVVGN